MMFGFFRRRPSAYAVAIRESMIREPEKWSVRNSTNAVDIMKCSAIEIGITSGLLWRTRIVIFTPFLVDVSRADRRCIREGIEAWIAWSVSKGKSNGDAT